MLDSRNIANVATVATACIQDGFTAVKRIVNIGLVNVVLVVVWNNPMVSTPLVTEAILHPARTHLVSTFGPIMRHLTQGLAVLLDPAAVQFANIVDKYGHAAHNRISTAGLSAKQTIHNMAIALAKHRL